MKYLIFGATGNVGSRVTERLIARGKRPAVFVRNAKKAKVLFGDQVDIHVGDLETPRSSLAAALAGIDRVFLVTDGPELDARDRAVAMAGKLAGLRHVVKLSTLDVYTGVGTGPWHARGELAIRDSGLPCTFIQSAGFMSNALGWSDSIGKRGVLRTSTGQGKIAFIHPDDIADVATAALVTQDHDGKSLVITGPEALSYGEMRRPSATRLASASASRRSRTGRRTRTWCAGPARAPTRTRSSTFGARCAKGGWPPCRTG